MNEWIIEQWVVNNENMKNIYEWMKNILKTNNEYWIMKKI